MCYASVVLRDSAVTFLVELDDATFFPSLSCVLAINRVATSEKWFIEFLYIWVYLIRTGSLCVFNFCQYCVEFSLSTLFKFVFSLLSIIFLTFPVISRLADFSLDLKVLFLLLFYIHCQSRYTKMSIFYRISIFFLNWPWLYSIYSFRCVLINYLCAFLCF